MLTKDFAVSFATVFVLVFLASDIATKACLARASESLQTPLFDGSLTISPQAEVRLLKAREALKQAITRDQVQSFNIALTAGEYAEVVFEWQGINLSVALFDPTGVKLIPANVQVSSPGPVSVSIVGEKSGTYRLEVSTPVMQRISGNYELKLEEPRLPTAADRKRIAAQTQIALGQNASAAVRVQNYNQALALLQEAGELHGEARVRMLLGDAYRAARDVHNAKANYERAALIWNKNNYLRGEAYAKVGLGILYRSLVAPKDAHTFFEEARLLFEQIGDKRGQADGLYGQAFALMLIGQTPQAIQVLEPALQLRRADEDLMGEASALNMMADAYRMLGDFERSLDLYDQATMVLKGLEHRSLEAALINGRALVYHDQGYWQKARDEYLRTLALFESLLGQPVLNACTSNPSSQDAPFCRSAAVAILNIGETYNSLGEPEKALAEFSRSLIISDALGRPIDQGAARFHLGYAHFLLGDSAKALEYYQKALEFQQKAGDEKGKALTYTYMGMASTARGEHRLALQLYQKALPIQQASGDKRALAITLDKLSTGYGLVGNASEASINYAKALELWRAIKDPDGEALTLYNMARAERLAGNLSTANQHSEATLKLVESLRSRLSSQKLRTSYLANKEDYYQLNVDLKMQLAKSGKQVEYITAALESNEKARARVLLDALSEAGVGRSEFNQTSDPRLTGLIELRLTLLAKLGARAQARTRLLSANYSPEQIAAIDKEINEITEKYDSLEAQVRSQSPRFAALTKPQPSSLAEIQQQLDGNTLLLEYALGDKRSYVWAVTPNSIDGFELPARDQIEPVARRVTQALTVRNREEQNESFPQKTARFDRAEQEYDEASAALSKMILAPVASLLAQKRLVVVADGALQMVPFAALPVPSNSATAENPKPTANSSTAVARGPMPLITSHEIITLPSASVLALQRRELANRKPAPLAVAVLADPVFDVDDRRVARSTEDGNQHRTDVSTSEKGEQLPAHGAASSPAGAANAHSVLATALRDVGLNEDGKMRRLALSRQEAKAIAQVAPANQSLSALDFKASRETATSRELSKYRIIHFATHGILNLEHPELSGIVLSMIDEKGQQQDGYLRLHEIYNLNLPAELVVLSACQTGVGKQIKREGLIALTRGFMYAGAKSVVASYWKVDDAATAALMAEFYKQMFTNKLKPAAALTEAQRRMSQQRRWQSPYYWAGFFLQGEWN